jgi:leucine dehydrogenase
VSPFDEMARSGHEEVLFRHDPATGLKAIIAVHSTVLGPALGGCRMYPYEREEDALDDVLRLSRGMTYKAAVAGVPLGGGKSVILGDPIRDKSEALLRSFGRFVGTLHGRYTASEDVGTSMDDLAVMRTETPHITGALSGPEGDINFLTALGTFEGLRAGVEHALGRTDLSGLVVAVQGLGHVGWPLCEMLAAAGAKLVVADVRAELVSRAGECFGAQAADPSAILTTECDVLSPCAMGAILDAQSIPRLRCRLVAGSANNVLRAPEHGVQLHERGIVLAPDYVVNAGGLIAEACQLASLDFAAARERVLGIHDTLTQVLQLAERDGIAPSDAADRLAEQRLAEATAGREVAA